MADTTARVPEHPRGPPTPSESKGVLSHEWGTVIGCTKRDMMSAWQPVHTPSSDFSGCPADTL